MTTWRFAGLAVIAACSAPRAAAAPEPSYVATSGAIAIANLDHQIAQRGADPGAPGTEELLLVRARFLADTDALDRATTLGEARSATAGDLVRRARTRAADHRFTDALGDVVAAERAGGDPDELRALRGSILVATGRAGEAIAALEAAVARHPGYASHSALAGAYAAVGRFVEADQLYATALGELDTTLPFPYAWTYFARALMWTEQAGEPARGAALYRQALRYLPAFAAANLHLAELEVAQGDVAAAIARLDRVVAESHDPEAMALLGQLHVRAGDPVRGAREIDQARRRFEALLVRHLRAFADHAAEFYLGPGGDADRAWALAQHNLAERQTDRAVALALRAAAAAGQPREACTVLAMLPGAATRIVPAACRGAP